LERAEQLRIKSSTIRSLAENKQSTTKALISLRFWSKVLHHRCAITELSGTFGLDWRRSDVFATIPFDLSAFAVVLPLGDAYQRPAEQ
jgi:hypothetical protein